jgi:mRNA-decapping enzyme 1B
MAATIDSEIRRQANLRSLQRIDPKIQDLGTTVSHVVLYEFSASKRTWEKKNIDGSLFIVKRSELPMFQLMVLNRSSNENLIVPLSASFQMQLVDPYLIFRDAMNTEEGIRGIWFHDGEERDNFVRYVENVVKAMGQIEEMGRGSNSGVGGGGNLESSTGVKTETTNDAGAALLATLNLGKSESVSKAVETSDLKQPRSAAAAGTNNNNNIVLDKKSLQLSLLSLIQDERFLDLIHAQYIKVVNARNAREQQVRRGSDK